MPNNGNTEKWETSVLCLDFERDLLGRRSQDQPPSCSRELSTPSKLHSGFVSSFALVGGCRH
eukprot:4531359-Amphidinium_carterae.1